MMIKTPVSYSESVTVFYPYPQIDDVDGEFLFEVKDKESAKEIVKRINMHDELVNALQDAKDFTDWYYTGKADGGRPKKPLNEIAKNIGELLERCK